MFGYDATIFLVLIGSAIVMYAQYKVQSTFNKYNEMESQNRMSGRQAASQILQSADLNQVAVEQVAGHLTDHYDPRSKVLRLSQSTYNETSIAAIAVAAHETGHALQDKEGYAFLKFRSLIAPAAQIGSSLAVPMMLLGWVLNIFSLVNLGIIAFGLVLLFQVITLPVEFNASSRALTMLENQQLVTAEELPAAKKVLNAAAFTYIAATLNSALTLLRFILISRRRN
ncbi:zinc metallopeptidase [Fundicoccus culcitae]|uniref:Zinc metallopeptidase n=2 Tax=Fundicoccus culcitae TaxID=2969821 RepID=A0ABY5P9R3_9LACT|nr:zinc metallopeptidase [Fundicoccus culcitae]UUX35496.1 zinc metallopeptidase [Fundicoccus culcitae]